MRLNESIKTGVCLALLISPLFCVPLARAITIDTVPIGNPGNQADTRYYNGYDANRNGAVSQYYDIGRTEVTNAQYVAFLNAVAATDPYGLFVPNVGYPTFIGVVRNGTSGHYTYSVKAAGDNGAYNYATKPVVEVSFGSALRFANWLHNGQPTGGETATTTENGAYALNGATTDDGLNAVTRKAGARWWIPSQDEWYKAAYYNPRQNVYYDYPTGTNDVPTSAPPSTALPNSANYDIANGNGNYPMTDAGAYTLSPSPYGTFDQGGNVSEWNEAKFVDLSGTFIGRGVRGGAFNYHTEPDCCGYAYLSAGQWGNDLPTGFNDHRGFRVASLPGAAGISGDFDGSGKVDAGDYVRWRVNNGSAADYSAWRARFGNSVSASGSSIGGVAVPEPSSFALFLVAIVTSVAGRRVLALHNRVYPRLRQSR